MEPSIEEQSNPELQAVPKRQAHAANAGFEYQYWLSVLAWVELDAQQLLKIEGAEDFDILGSSESTAIQAKHLKAAVTLRSACIVEALNNAYDLFQRHQQKTIFYRFVTTATAAIENDNPFGTGIKGLHIWNSGDTDPSLFGNITLFLIKEEKVSAQLIKYLQKTPQTELNSLFFSRIKFDYGADDTSHIEQLVHHRLTMHGETHGVVPSECIKVAPHLLRRVLKCASDKQSIPLSRKDFLELFETETHISLPLSSLNNAINAFCTSMLAIHSGQRAFLQEMHDITPPKPPQPLMRRHILENAISSALKSQGCIYLVGSSGTGKSVLASIIATTHTGIPIWIHVDGSSMEIVEKLLQEGLSRCAQKKAVPLIVLDDIPLMGKKPLDLTQRLSVIIKKHEGYLISTLQRVPHGSGLTDDEYNRQVIVVSMMKVLEVQAALLQMGCPGHRIISLANIIQLQTSGHPQLVHARLRRLKEQNWPDIDEKDILITPPEIEAEQHSVRLLLHSVRNEQEREAIYRMSVWALPFRRDHFLNVADIPPALPQPGEAFDQLLGPWIEQISESHFRLSPLLKNAAQGMWSKERTADLEYKIASAALKTKKLSAIEMSAILRIGITGKKEVLVVAVLMVAIDMGFQRRSELAGIFPWLPYIWADGSQPIYESNSFLNTYLRLLQSVVAAHNDFEEPQRFIEYALSEADVEADHEVANGQIASILIQALMMPELKLAGNVFVRFLTEFYERFYAASNHPIFRNVRWSVGKHWRREPIGIEDLTALMLSFAKSKTHGSTGLWYVNVAEACEADHKVLKIAFTTLFAGDPFLGRHLIDKCWLAEEIEHDWQRALHSLSKFLQAGLRWNCLLMVESAAKGIMVVHDEYLGNAQKALEMADSFAAHISDPSVHFLDARANILSRMGRKAEAVSIWKNIIPYWKVPDYVEDTSVLFAASRAGAAAGLISDWNVACFFFEYASAETIKCDDKRYLIGFEMDATFACYKIGQFDKMVAHLKAAINHLMPLPNDKSDPRTYKLWRMVTHVALYLHTVTDRDPASGGVDVPFPGQCSNIEPPRNIADMPDLVPQMTVSLAASVEWKFAGTCDLVELYRETLKRQDNPVVDASRFMNLLTSTIFNKRWIEIPDLALSLAKCLREFQMNSASGFQAVGSEADYFMVNDAVIVALFYVSLGHNNPLELVEGLISYEGQQSEKLTSWAIEARKFMRVHQDARSAWNYLRGEGVTSNGQIWATALMLHENTDNPEMLIHSHALTLYMLKQNSLKSIVGRQIGMAVSKSWQRACLKPFLLRSPRLTLPPLKQAIQLTPYSIRSAASVLLAAKHTTSMRLPKDLEAYLAEIRLD